jgi:hypothetical protein
MRRVLILLAVGALAVAAAGCGGGNKSASGTTTSTTTTTTTTTTTAAGATTTAGNTATTPVFASGKCKSLALSAQKIGKDLSAASAGGNLQDVAKEFQAFANTVPSEIKGDVQTIAAAITKYASVLKTVHFTPGQTPSTADLLKVQAALKQIDQPKLQAAEKHLEAWTQKNCT